MLTLCIDAPLAGVGCAVCPAIYNSLSDAHGIHVNYLTQRVLQYAQQQQYAAQQAALSQQQSSPTGTQPAQGARYACAHHCTPLPVRQPVVKCRLTHHSAAQRGVHPADAILPVLRWLLRRDTELGARWAFLFPRYHGLVALCSSVL